MMPILKNSRGNLSLWKSFSIMIVKSNYKNRQKRELLKDKVSQEILSGNEEFRVMSLKLVAEMLLGISRI